MALRVDFQSMAAVFIGGGTGCVLRYLLACFINSPTVRVLPFHTLCANVVGCFIIGLAFSFFALKTEFSANLKLLLTVGFCGGLTTFSTFSLEVVNLLGSRNYSAGILYAVVSAVLCLLATVAGMFIGGLIGKRI